jgi:uncharacterized RDD family membrane protein YckC
LHSYTIHSHTTYLKAGFWLRVSALTLDEVVLVVITGVLVVGIQTIFGHHVLSPLWQKILFYELLDYNYYTLCWVFGGQTIGKRILRTKVLKTDFTPLTYKDAFIRYWVWMVGVAMLGVGYFWIGFDKDKRGWNDIAARTMVVRIVSAFPQSNDNDREAHICKT